MIAYQNFNDTFFTIFYPTASATVYGRRPKFFRAEHSATAEGENCAYGPTLANRKQGFWKLDHLKKCWEQFFDQMTQIENLIWYPPDRHGGPPFSFHIECLGP